MVAELTYEPGFAQGLDQYSRILRYRVDEVTYLVQDQRTDEAVFLQMEIEGFKYEFTHIPYEDDAFAWVARQQFNRSNHRVVVLMDGEHLPVEMDRLREVDTAKMVGPIWCPVANMTAQRPYGPGGIEIKRGSRHFAAGAKLFYRTGFWGTAADQVEVVGRQRGSHRYVTMIVSSSWLVNWRVELLYSPHVIRELWPHWSGTEHAKLEAQRIADIFRQRTTSDDLAGEQR